MKTNIKTIALSILTVAFVSCTIVMPTAEPAKTKEDTPTYTRPTPTTTAGANSPTYNRPTPTTTVGASSPTYNRPTPTTTAGASNSTYNRPKPTTTVTHKSDSVASTSTSKEVRSDGRIDAPKGKNAEAVSDTTVQARSRVRR